MRFATSFAAAAVALLSTVCAQTVYLAGDSTMTAPGNNDGTAGWGVDLNTSITYKVVNDAITGRSARSFTREGHFAAMAAVVRSGDYVVIEFGHNDGGSLTPTDNGRTDCSPVGTDYSVTCQTTYNGVAETVLTYTQYLINAADLFKSKGTYVIISTATPNNVWETGTYAYSANRFVGYCQTVASVARVDFVDHGATTAAAYEALGATAVDAFYPHDHTYTSPAGAKVVEQAFITGLKASNSPLKNHLK